MWKRALDLFLILLFLPLLVPLMLLLSLWIRIAGGKPIFFKQERVGYLGRRFICFKFRTMRAGVDTTAHQAYTKQLMTNNKPMVKLDTGDPRLIPFALPLRSTGLDELPQLFNVLRGEMSLVGPRPCLPSEYEHYLPWQRERFNTAPGLTGLWQVNGKNKTTFVEMVRFDIEYTRKRSLWLDLRIVLKTVPALMIQAFETHRKKKLSVQTAP